MQTIYNNLKDVQNEIKKLVKIKDHKFKKTEELFIYEEKIKEIINNLYTLHENTIITEEKRDKYINIANNVLDIILYTNKHLI